MKKMTVDSKNKTYLGKGNCIIKRQNGELISACKNSIIPSDGSVKTIGASAFRDCSTLKKIAIPFGVTKIGNRAFYGCKNLTEIVIPNGVSGVAQFAFYGCRGLERVTFGKSVNSLGRSSFEGCVALKSVFCAADQKQWLSDVSIGNNNNELLDADFIFKCCNYAGHQMASAIVKATLTSDGSVSKECTICGEKNTTKIFKIKTIALSKTKLLYTGKALTPVVTVKDSKGKTLKLNSDYCVSYKNNKKPGTSTVTVTFKGNYSGKKALSFAILPPAVTKLSVKQTATGITASWKAAKGADGYKVYLYKGKKFVKTVDSSKTSVAFKKLSSGADYKIVVISYMKSGKDTVLSSTSAEIKTATKPAAPSLSVKGGNRQAKVSWKKVSGADSYTVYYSTDKKSGYKKLITTKNSITVKNLKSGKTYYFKAVATHKVGKTSVKSSFSSVKSVKVK